MKTIPENIIHEAMDYKAYKSLLNNLLAQGKTTGPKQSEEYLNFAKINLQRMQRLEKTVQLSNELKSAFSKLKSSYIFLAITEGWCGDAAQNLPVFCLIDQEFKNIELKLILRDEHLDIMDHYLTHGSRSIPKIICLNKNSLEECFVWGPRPSVLQEMVMQMKNENKSHEERGLASQNWYNADKTNHLQTELLELIKKLH